MTVPFDRRNYIRGSESPKETATPSFLEQVTSVHWWLLAMGDRKTAYNWLCLKACLCIIDILNWKELPKKASDQQKAEHFRDNPMHAHPFEILQYLQEYGIIRLIERPYLKSEDALHDFIMENQVDIEKFKLFEEIAYLYVL